MFTPVRRVAVRVRLLRHAFLTLVTVLLPALVFAQNGTVTGTLTNNITAAPVQGAQVTFCRNTGGAGSCIGGVTNASGAYTSSLPPGTYYAFTSFSGLVNEIYNDVPCPSSVCSSELAFSAGMPFVVNPGGTTSGINFALDPGGSMAGTITDAATGAPLPNVAVNVFARVGTQTPGAFVGSSLSDAGGNYIVTGLPSGIYYAATSTTVYANEIYDDVLCPGTCSSEITVQSGTGIVVVNGQTSAGRNFALRRGGTITGTITNAATSAAVSGAHVTVWTRIGDSLSQVALGFSLASGVYTVSGLPAGMYYVNTTGNSAGLMNEIYNNIPCEPVCSPALPNPGSPILVTWGATTANIDFQLDPGGSIAGTITDAGTTLPLQGAGVTMYRQVGAGVQNVGFTSTGATGQYAVGGLPSGVYFAVATSQAYVNEVYNNVPCIPTCGPSTITSATPINVVAGSETSGVDFGLAAGGTISGAIIDSTTSAPIGGVTVALYTPVGGTAAFVSSTLSNSSGAWTIRGLPAGNYFAFTDQSGQTQRWRNEIYNDLACPDVCSPATATASGTPIAATPGATTAGIDFGLSPNTSAPSPPTGFAITVNNFVARLSWRPATSGGVATTFLIEAGLGEGQTLVTLNTATPSLDVPGVPPGRFYVRVRAVNAFGSSPPSNEYLLIVNGDGSGVLNAPVNLSARMNGGRVTVTWGDPLAGSVPTSYILEVGTGAGLSNLVSFPVTSRNFSFEPVPNGVYFLRIRARNGAQISPPSGEAMIVVGNLPSPPEAPRNLSHTLAGSTVTLAWELPYFATPTSYIIEAGTASGLANIATVPTGSTALGATFTGVPPGMYYVRVRAVNAQGAGVASNETVIVVP